MDWHLLKWQQSSGPKPFSGSTLLIAMVFNVFIRFSWLPKLPNLQFGTDTFQRAILQDLEIARRVTWCYFRTVGEQEFSVKESR